LPLWELQKWMDEVKIDLVKRSPEIEILKEIYGRCISNIKSIDAIVHDAIRDDKGANALLAFIQKLCEFVTSSGSGVSETATTC